MTGQPPKRRWQLRLDLEADSLIHLAEALESIAYDVAATTMPTERVSGGMSSGYVLHLDCDETMTAERYAAEIAAWAQSRRSEHTS